ncbi:unnamed protein product [Trichobilharzia regenti]|nr:unnamed protein product [Trichobilharzia regenti]
MVNPIKSMACRHVQNMVQSVSKCSGNEAPYSPVIDTNSDSASSSVNTSKSCKISGQPEKKTECHSESDERCHSKNCLAPNISSPYLDDRQSPNDYLWQKLEALIDQMISEEDGIPVRNVKSLMSVIPSTFTGLLLFASLHCFSHNSVYLQINMFHVCQNGDCNKKYQQFVFRNRSYVQV